MAHGRAIIASDLPVLHEVLVDRVNSLLYPPNAPRVLVQTSQAVDRLLQEVKLAA